MLFQILILFLPWCFRRRLLQWMFDWDIAPSAVIGKSIVLARHLVMGPKSRIHDFVFCKRIDHFEMGEDSGIAQLTFITGFPTSDKRFFKHVPMRKCELVLGAHAGITSRHFVDCNGGVYIGDYTTVAGIRTQILTHSIDIYKNQQDTRPVHIGKYCFVGTGCILLPGSSLPDYSVLGAGAVLTKAYADVGRVYAGVPARIVKEIDVNVPYFHRIKHVVN